MYLVFHGLFHYMQTLPPALKVIFHRPKVEQHYRVHLQI